MAITKKDVDGMCVTLLWSSIGDDGEPMDRKHTITQVSGVARSKLRELAEAVEATAPPGVTVDDKVLHRAVLDVAGHGTGIWDDHGEDWDGHGRAWSQRIRATKAGMHLRDKSAILGDDGKIYIE